jgi:hypothetical protein
MTYYASKGSQYGKCPSVEIAEGHLCILRLIIMTFGFLLNPQILIPELTKTKEKKEPRNDDWSTT